MLPNVSPMLASPAEPFDSGEHVFEVKWDGVRALAAVEPGGWRLWGRESADYTGRYPELDVLRRFPSGTLVDGEVVVLRDGRADLNALLSRHALVSSTKIEHARRHSPVYYILFDALYHQGRSLLSEPLWRRRMVLTDLMEELDEPTLVFSEGIVCTGQDFFERVIEQGHEGVVAKHLAGRYHPGRRSTAWQKIKPAHELPCVVIGYTPAPSGLHSLLVGECQHGITALRCRADRRLHHPSAGTPGRVTGPPRARQARRALQQESRLGGTTGVLPRAVPASDAQRFPARRLVSRSAQCG